LFPERASERKEKEIEKKGSTHLTQQPQDLETPTVNFERGRAREAVQAIADGIEQIEDELRHCCVSSSGGVAFYFVSSQCTSSSSCFSPPSCSNAERVSR
jgi:hypothetical protein